MLSLFSAQRVFKWSAKHYLLGIVALLIIAAAPALLPAIPDHIFSVNENSPLDMAIGGINPSKDSDGQPLDFAITSQSVPGAFVIEAATGIIKVADPALLNYETTQSIVLGVRATADKGTDTEESTDITVSIQLKDVGELPTATTGAATAVTESAAMLAGAVRDNGAVTTYAFQLSSSTNLPAVDPATLAGAQTIAASSPAQNVSFSAAGLNVNTIYYYRLVAKNSLGTTYGETKTFTTATIPAVVSILRNNPSPTNATSLTYKVTFSEAVSGLDAGDFMLKMNGTATGSIATVAAVSGSVYTVTITSVSGDGQLTLEFRDNNSVISNKAVPVGGRAISDGDFFSAEVYLIDSTAPGIKIENPSYLYTQVGPAYFYVDYSEPADIVLAAGHINLIKTGTATGTIEVAYETETRRRITIRNISGDGTLKFNIAANTATDAAGNKAAQAGPSATLIVDNTAPVAQCPASITVQNDANKCEAYVNVPIPVFSDNTEPGVVKITVESPDWLKGVANASGTYPIGESTVVTWRFTDQSGNYKECSTTVTVEDVAPPVVVNCPENIIQGTDPNSCSAKVEFEVLYTDNCAGATLTQLSALGSGSIFPLGVTPVAYEITDAKGNKTQCSFTVTVVDDQAPQIACPADKVVDVVVGSNGAVVNYQAPTATDNCSTAGELTITQTAGLPSGSFFPSGNTINTFTAKDKAGNISTCSFTVTVLDDDAPTIVISEPSVRYTRNGPVTYTVTYYGATTISLAKSHIVINKTGSAIAADYTVTGTGNQRTVTITGISGTGTMGISIVAGTASDNVGNTAPAAGPSEIFYVDNTGPAISEVSDLTTLEDTPTGAIAFNISDDSTPGSELLVSVASNNTTLIPTTGYRLSGTGANRNLVITPALHRHGNAVVTITVKDRMEQLSTRSFTLTVQAVADAPQMRIVVNPARGPEDTQIPLQFTADLVDQDGSESIISYQIENVPAGATLSAGTNQGNGMWRLTPAQLASLTILPPKDFTGRFTLRIRATSKEGSNTSQAESATADLEVIVEPVNDAPGFSLSEVAIVRPEDFPEEVVINVINLTDADSDLSNIRFSLTPAKEEVNWVNISINATTGQIVLKSIKDKNQATPFTFKVKANDGNTANNIAEKTFTVQINPVNDAPVISIASPWIEQEDFTGTPTRSVTVSPAPADEVGETITYTVTPAPATLTFINLAFANGTFTATAVPNAFGSATLKIVAFDGTSYSRELQLEVIVEEVNDAPAFTLEKNVIREKEDFSKTTGDVVVKINSNDPDTNPAAIEYELMPASVDWVNISVNATDKTLVLKSVDNKNYRQPFTFTLKANDRASNNNTFEQTFTVQIDSVNDAPYGMVKQVMGPNPLAFQVEARGGIVLSPDVYKDVDMQDVSSTEKLRVRLEGAPSWLSIEHGYVDKNNNNQLENSEWISQLVGNPPLEEEGARYTIRAYVTDEHNVNLLNPTDLNEVGQPKRYDEFEVIAVCNNNLPVAPEDEIEIVLSMNVPLQSPRLFTILDDAKSVGPTGEFLHVEAIEVDNTMLQEVKVEMIDGTQGIWAITNMVPVRDQYGTTTFRIKINDYKYCNSDQEEREPVYIEVTVYIELEDKLDIPTLITPNGDRYNDSWNILGLELYASHEIRVFDTRGRLIFTSKNYGPASEWNGTYNGTPLPDGAYPYQIIFNDGKEKREGYITIAR